VFGSGLLVEADELGGPGRIEGANLAPGAQALTAYDEVVLAAELCGNLVERGLHGPGNVRGFEVMEGFVDKLPVRGAMLNLS
jgi:hypothetical protein